MEDRLDVVAVGIEQEGGVVAGMITALTWPAIILAASGKPCLVKFRYRLAIRDLESEVHPRCWPVGGVDPQFVGGKKLSPS